MDDIVRMVTELVQSASAVPDAQKLFPSDRPSVGTCPCCGAAVTETAKGFFAKAVSVDLAYGRITAFCTDWAERQ